MVGPWRSQANRVWPGRPTARAANGEGIGIGLPTQGGSDRRTVQVSDLLRLEGKCVVPAAYVKVVVVKELVVGYLPGPWVCI